MDREPGTTQYFAIMSDGTTRRRSLSPVWRASASRELPNGSVCESISRLVTWCGIKDMVSIGHELRVMITPTQEKPLTNADVRISFEPPLPSLRKEQRLTRRILDWAVSGAPEPNPRRVLPSLFRQQRA